MPIVVVAEFLRAFADEVAARQLATSGARDRLTQELAEIERRLAGVLRAIEDGAWSDVVRTRLALEPKADLEDASLKPLGELQSCLRGGDRRPQAACGDPIVTAAFTPLPHAGSPDSL